MSLLYRIFPVYDASNAGRPQIDLSGRCTSAGDNHEALGTFFKVDTMKPVGIDHDDPVHFDIRAMRHGNRVAIEQEEGLKRFRVLKIRQHDLDGVHYRAPVPVSFCTPRTSVNTL